MSTNEELIHSCFVNILHQILHRYSEEVFLSEQGQGRIVLGTGLFTLGSIRILYQYFIDVPLLQVFVLDW